MITVSRIKNQYGNLVGFVADGHAGFANSGKDIVCAAVSALIITTVNSVEALTDARFKAEQSEGHTELIIQSEITPDVALLLNSLFLGLSGIQEEVGTKYLKID